MLSLKKNRKRPVPDLMLAVFTAVALFLPGCEREQIPRQEVARAFFSADDGKTWFADDGKRIPPFTREGKEAVRAQVYRCPDGMQFVAWLERFTAESKKQLEAVLNKPKDAPPALPTDVPQMEVKAPGEGTWISSSDPRAAAIMTPKCAGGGTPEVVTP